jgi:hypothetical protein
MGSALSANGEYILLLGENTTTHKTVVNLYKGS